MWDLLYCWGWNKGLKSSVRLNDLDCRFIQLEGRIDTIKFIQFLRRSLSDEMILAIVGVWEGRVVWKGCVSWFFPQISAWHVLQTCSEACWKLNSHSGNQATLSINFQKTVFQFTWHFRIAGFSKLQITFLWEMQQMEISSACHL